jgi:hypothetical protein
MTDQEKLSGRLTQVGASSKRASAVEPRILELKHLDGKYIPPESVIEVSEFFITAVGTERSTADLLDGGITIAAVKFDETGHVTTLLSHQSVGTRVYTVRDEFGQESSPWVITIALGQLLIESVKGPDGQLIENGSSTAHTDLSFVGNGPSNQVVELVDNGIVSRLVNVDLTGHFSARIQNLKPGPHKFVVRALNGKESAAWDVEIEKPALLSIQFGFGQGNHQPIEDGETTTQTAVVLVGTATPHESGLILSDAQEGVEFIANEYGIFNALVENLLPGLSYTFVCRSYSDRQSAPWTIKVASSKLPPL